jgi:hypothetical protein
MNSFDLLPEAEAPELYSHDSYSEMNMDDGSAMDTDGSPEANIRALDAFSWPGAAQYDSSAVQPPYVSFQPTKSVEMDPMEYVAFISRG